MSAKDENDLEKYINQLSKEFDDFLKELKKKNRSTEKKLTFPILLKGIGRVAFRVFKSVFTFRGIFSVVALYLLGKFTASAFTLQQILIGAAIITILVLLWMLLRIYALLEMSKSDNPHFNMGAFELIKPKEYTVLHPYFNDEHFEFAKFKEELKKKHTLDEKVVDDYKKEISELKTTVEGLITLLDENEIEAKLFKDKYNNLHKFLKSLSSSIEQLKAGASGLKSVRFDCDFSLYELQSEKLVFLGCFGLNEEEQEKEIPLSNTDHHMVSALTLHNKARIVTDNTIITQRIRGTKGRTWVVNIHLDDSNKKELNPDDDLGKMNLDTQFLLFWTTLQLMTSLHEKVEKDKDGERHDENKL